MSILEEDKSTVDAVAGIDRRSFVGYVLAGTTLVAAADFALGSPAGAASGVNGPQIAEFYDLNDFIDQTCLPTASLVTVTVNTDGTAPFALPRSENGQGITDLDGDDHRRGARLDGGGGLCVRAGDGRFPTYFPINHKDPLPFKVKTFVPPIPPSPVNGLKKTY